LKRQIECTQAHASVRERSLAAREAEVRRQELDLSEDTIKQRLELSEEMQESRAAEVLPTLISAFVPVNCLA
jgi:hypothetical protein